MANNSACISFNDLCLVQLNNLGSTLVRSILTKFYLCRVWFVSTNSDRFFLNK